MKTKTYFHSFQIKNNIQGSKGASFQFFYCW